MSRPLRLDFHGAIHIVHVQGRDEIKIYFDASALHNTAAPQWSSVPHARRYLQLLDESCSECGAQLFAFCIEPNDASLVLKRTGAPLDACMRRLGGRYSRYLHAKQVLPESVRPFATRYEAKVVAPEYLPHALRRVHACARRAGWARRTADYPFSSAAAYLGARPQVRLETGAVWRALELKGLFGLRDYQIFMEKADTPYVTALFEEGSPLDARVVGGNLFVAQARDATGHPSPLPTREQLLAGVAQLLGAEPASMFGSGHLAVLGRALVAWYAQRSGVASLREVGSWFDVTGATLGKGIKHYRRASAELFESKSLPGIAPAAGDSDD